MKDSSYGIIPIFKTKYENLFLVLKSIHGHWTFPKGHKEGGELPIESAMRELREETGILITKILDNKTLLETYSFTKDNTIIDKTNTFFIGYVFSTEVTIDKNEIDEYRWVTQEEAKSLLFSSGTKMLDEVVHYLNKNG